MALKRMAQSKANFFAEWLYWIQQCKTFSLIKWTSYDQLSSKMEPSTDKGGGGVLHAWRIPQGCTGSLFVIQKNSRDDRWGWTMLSAFRETWNIKGQLRVGWQKTITMERVGNGSDWAPHSLEYLGGSRTVDRIVPLIRCGDSACHS